MEASLPGTAATSGREKPGFLATNQLDPVKLTEEVAVMSVKIPPKPKSISKGSEKRNLLLPEFPGGTQCHNWSSWKMRLREGG